jgi:hypothetical protein
MIKVRIKVKNDTTTFSHVEFLPETYNVSKENADLQKIVEKTVKASHLQDVQDVLVTASFQW